MFFNDDEAVCPNPGELFQAFQHEIYLQGPNTPFGWRKVPTHTEDGIPIRKIYVSNIPPKTTRSEIFNVFAQYGFIKHCWVRMDDRGGNNVPTPAYAFVTYSSPEDAYKALQAPSHERSLRGRNLKISPADSWHQPAEDADGKVLWKTRSRRDRHTPTHATEGGSVLVQEEMMSSEETLETEIVDNCEQEYCILDILNRDCWTQILSYIPIVDLIRSERVSKRWQSMVREYMGGVRTYKTSWWQDPPSPVTLTTAVLRAVLARLGGLTRLHIDHQWSSLNDRTAHTVGKFCPNLDELMVVSMQTRNWNPVIYGCKQLKIITFKSCNKLTDASLVHIVNQESSIESLTVTNNSHVTGLFLSSSEKLSSLAFYNCYSLQGTVLNAAVENLPNLRTLKLDVCPIVMWKMIPLILKKLPKLEELSLSEYVSMDICVTQESDETFCDAVSCLTKLKVLNLSRNVNITNSVMKQISQTCIELESLNISSCNSKKNFPFPFGRASMGSGVSDEGLLAVCRGCQSLSHLDVSYLEALSDAGLRHLGSLPQLTTLIARGNPTLTAAPFAHAIASCHQLQVVDVCGCDSVSEELVSAAVRALDARPRPLTLWLATTAAAEHEMDLTGCGELPSHTLLTVNVVDDRSNPHLRPDFVDRLFEDSSDDSLDDLYEHDDFDEFFGPEDELFLDEDELDEDYEAVYAVALYAPNIMML